MRRMFLRARILEILTFYKMSLGKGLESLIPPSQGSGRNDENKNLVNSRALNNEPAGLRPISDLDRGIGPLNQKPTPVEPKQFPKEEAINLSAKAGADKPFGSVSSKPSDSAQDRSFGAAPSTAKAPEDRQGKPFDATLGKQTIFQIETDKVKPNPHQPRREFNDEALGELAASIREFGILQPLVVTKVEVETPTGQDVEYTLIAGERRLKAAKLAGLPTVPAIIRNIGLERERLEMAIIENLQRENLNPIERGRAFARLQDEFNLTQREIAVRLGKSRAAVANTMRLLDLPSYIQNALSGNQISESHGRLLLAIEDDKTRERMFRDLVDMKLTTRELKDRVGKIKNSEGSGIFSIDLSPEIKMFQEELATQLGAPVKIDHKGDGGKITITFYSDEELQGIIDRLKKENGGGVGW